MLIVQFDERGMVNLDLRVNLKKNSLERKTREDVEISRQQKTAKRNRTTEFVEKNGERQLCETGRD